MEHAKKAKRQLPENIAYEVWFLAFKILQLDWLVNTGIILQLLRMKLAPFFRLSPHVGDVVEFSPDVTYHSYKELSYCRLAEI